MKQQRQSKGLYFYTPKQYEDGVDILVTFSALSHGQIIALDDLLDDRRSGEFIWQVCKLSIKSIEDIEGNSVPFNTLSPRTLSDVSTKILEMSSVTQEELDSLQKSINIKFGKSFQAETWNCEVCQAKRLDKTRNCGFRGEKDKDPSFVIHADNQAYTYCPI